MNILDALREGRIDEVKALIEEGVDVNTRDERSQTPLMLAAFNGNLEIVKALVERGADVNARANNGYTPLLLTTVTREANAVEIVDLLLDEGADINGKDQYGWTPLMTVIYAPPPPPPPPQPIESDDEHDTEMDKWYEKVQQQIKVQVGIVKTLLARGADFNARANDGITALMIAEECHQDAIVQLLKEASARK